MTGTDETQPTNRVSGRNLFPDPKCREQLSTQVAAMISELTTLSLQAIEERLPWFSKLGANDRSWITLVAGKGIEGFVHWLSDNEQTPADTSEIFNAAPSAMARKISLQQTVDLLRISIDRCEEHLRTLPAGKDRDQLSEAAVFYSREVAFTAAEVYAKAAESRGQWDTRMESLVVDAVVRDDPDATIISRASTLGWNRPGHVCVVTGASPTRPDPELELLRVEASRLGLSVLASTQGSNLVVVLGGRTLTTEDTAINIVEKLATRFGDGPIVIGMIVKDLSEAHHSARTASSGLAAAKGWPEGPRVMPASALLPERVLTGDVLAKQALTQDVYETLLHSGSDLLETCVAFLDHTGSVEATARSLFVHANTVRYRLKKIEDATGYSPSNARGAYVLRLAISLGRLQQEQSF